MSEPNVRVQMTGHGRGEVFIDGQKVPGVKAVEVMAAVDQLNEVRLTLMPHTIEVEGVFDVSTIDSGTREYKVGNEG